MPTPYNFKNELIKQGAVRLLGQSLVFFMASRRKGQTSMLFWYRGLSLITKMHHPCAFHFAPPLCISLCTTLVHFTLHHPCAFCFAPPLCISLCTTLVHFALHHPCAFCFAPPLCILLCTTLLHRTMHHPVTS